MAILDTVIQPLAEFLNHPVTINPPIFALIVSIIIAIIIGGICFWLGRSIKLDSPELKITAVLVGGVFVLILTLAFLSICFSIINVGDKTQALGLPAGSMGAVIALSLVVLFAIVSVFLFQGISNSGAVQSVSGLTEAERNEFQQAARGYITSRNENQAQGAQARFTVYFQNNNTAGNDFARQLLVMLGTLMTAAASFYFGSNSTGGAGKPPGEQTTIINPSPTPSAQPTPTGGASPGPSASPSRAARSPAATPSASPSPKATVAPGAPPTPVPAPSPSNRQ